LSELQGLLEGNGSNQNTELPSAVEICDDGRPLTTNQLPLQRAASTGKPSGSLELEIRRRDGSSRFLFGRANPLLDEHRAVRGAVGAFYDVTERKRMEDILRERADLLELASEAIVVRDLQGHVTFWNSGAETLYGWSREEALGQPLHGLLRTDFPVPIAEINRALSESGTWAGNLVQRTKEGREVIVSSRKAMNAEGKAVLEINRDITSQLQAEEALRKAERLAAMGRVAGIVAHEINNPLEAISNAFYLLRDHPSLDQQARQLAIMGEQELMRLAYNQNIVVTLPGNTRFYIVLQDAAIAKQSVLAPAAGPAARTNIASAGVQALPTAAELRELISLKDELNRMYREVAATRTSDPQNPQQ